MYKLNIKRLQKQKTNSSTYLKTVFLGVGTNKGNRIKNISTALNHLSKHKQIHLLKVSQLLANPPQEGIKSGYFLNGAIKIATTLTPHKLLAVCKEIEKKLGRKITRSISNKKKKPRTIDLDILFYGKEIINDKTLKIPHPKIHKRYFVLIPLMEIGENILHPILKKRISDLYEESYNKISKKVS